MRKGDRTLSDVSLMACHHFPWACRICGSVERWLEIHRDLKRRRESDLKHFWIFFNSVSSKRLLTERDLTCLSFADIMAPSPSTDRLADGCTAKSARAGAAYARCDQYLGNTS